MLWLDAAQRVPLSCVARSRLKCCPAALGLLRHQPRHHIANLFVRHRSIPICPRQSGIPISGRPAITVVRRICVASVPEMLHPESTLPSPTLAAGRPMTSRAVVRVHLLFRFPHRPFRHRHTAADSHLQMHLLPPASANPRTSASICSSVNCPPFSCANAGIMDPFSPAQSHRASMHHQSAPDIPVRKIRRWPVLPVRAMTPRAVLCTKYSDTRTASGRGTSGPGSGFPGRLLQPLANSTTTRKRRTPPRSHRLAPRRRAPRRPGVSTPSRTASGTC